MWIAVNVQRLWVVLGDSSSTALNPSGYIVGTIIALVTEAREIKVPCNRSRMLVAKSPHLEPSSQNSEVQEVFSELQGIDINKAKDYWHLLLFACIDSFVSKNGEERCNTYVFENALSQNIATTGQVVLDSRWGVYHFQWASTRNVKATHNWLISRLVAKVHQAEVALWSGVTSWWPILTGMTLQGYI